MSNLFNTIKNVVYYTVVAFLSFVIIFSIARPGELIKVINVGWYKVVSKSMQPLIMVDDFIIAKKIDNADDLKDGDIIIFETYFYHNGSYSKDIVTHHFSHITSEGYIITYPHSQFGLDKDEIKYDSWYKNPDEKHFVTEYDLMGKHIETIPLHSSRKMIIYLFTRPLGITFILLGLSIVGYGFYYFSKSKESNEEVEEISEDELAYIFRNRDE